MTNADGKVTLQTQLDTKGLSQGISGLKGQFGALSRAASKLGKVIAGAFAVRQLVVFSKQAVAAAQAQEEAEVKLATVMKQRMGATEGMIQSVKNLTKAQQDLGVIGDEVQLAGAQQLATFLDSKDALETLIPAMNNLAAQQKGVNATSQDLVNIGNLVGKVMQGQTGALTRVGITFSAAEEKVLKYGNEQERAAMLAKVIKNNVGDMNSVLANTPAGQMKQLRNNLGDIMETLGSGIQNFITPFLKGINAMLQQLAKLANAFKAFSELITGKKTSPAAAASGLGEAASGAADYADATNDAAKATQNAAKAQNKYLSGLDEVKTYETQKTSDTSSSQNKTSANNKVDYGALEQGETVMEQYSAKMVKLVEDLKKAVKPFVDAFNDGMSKVDWSKITKSLGDLWEALKRFGSDVIYKNLLWLWEKVLVPLGTWTANNVVPRFLDTIRIAVDLLNNVLTAMRPGWEWFFDNVIQPVAEFTADLFLKAWDAINTALEKFSTWAKEHPKTIENITTAIIAFFAAWKVTTLISKIGKLISVLGTFGSTVATVIAGMNPWVVAIAAVVSAGVLLWKNWDVIKQKAQQIWGAISSTLSRIWGNIKNTARTFVDGVKNVFDKFLTTARNIWDSIGRAISGAIDNAVTTCKNLLNGLKTTFSNIFSAIASAIKAPINAIIGFINGLISGITYGINACTSALNKLKINIPSWVPKYGGRSLGFNIPQLRTYQIPYLASGAVIPPNAPFTAVLGDQRNGTNLETPEALLRKIVREESGSNGNYRFTAQINRRTLFDEMIAEAKLRQTTSGRNPFEMA